MSDKETLDEITNAVKELLLRLDNLEEAHCQRMEDFADNEEWQRHAILDRELERKAILDSLEGLGLEQKLEAYCKVIAEKKANNDYISAEIARLQKRKKSNDNAVDWLRGNMQQSLIAVNKLKVDTGLHKISISKRKTLKIDYDKLVEQGIPELIYKPAVIDKTATKKAIQESGLDIEGVEEIETTGVRIT
jgi:hypothetical protein